MRSAVLGYGRLSQLIDSVEVDSLLEERRWSKDDICSMNDVQQLR